MRRPTIVVTCSREADYKSRTASRDNQLAENYGHVIAAVAASLTIPLTDKYKYRDIASSRASSVPNVRTRNDRCTVWSKQTREHVQF